ncbi:MAG: hypothetical protein QOE77_3160 [Blastocatellia bacterium]|jgi:hypothetical protein|nr:hypothetical protein [Blastocatellia bacterium]
MTAVMMPETTMNENDCGVFWENHVGFAGKVFAVKLKAKSHSKQATAESKLQRSVLRSNCRHHSASNRFANSVDYRLLAPIEESNLVPSFSRNQQ